MGSGAGKRTSAVAPPTYGDLTIYLAQDPVDFRLGINGLSTMVEATLRFDPFSRNLFCFTNKRRNQIKVLYWQRIGFCLWLKRLEEERFKWPVHLSPLQSRGRAAAGRDADRGSVLVAARRSRPEAIEAASRARISQRAVKICCRVTRATRANQIMLRRGHFRHIADAGARRTRGVEG